MVKWMTSSLTIHVLNVGHGDSIVLQYAKPDDVAYGVIDSNAIGEKPPRALSKLKELGATELSFVCLTHPHRDHYRGLYRVFEEYHGRIRQFYTFPLARQDVKYAKRLAARYMEVVRRPQDDPDIRRCHLEFAQILRYAATELAPSGQWLECAGEWCLQAPYGFEGVEMYSILPPNKVIGVYMQQIMSESADVFNNLNDNNLSVALMLSFGSARIILGGDGSFENWLHHQVWRERAGRSIAGDVVKLPHHGSARDCRREILAAFFNEANRRWALISADGQSHPGDSVLRWLGENKVQPRCTNLARCCGAVVRRLVPAVQLDPVLARWLNQVSDEPNEIQPCQGDITVTVEESGRISVRPQYEHLCGCDGSLDQLFTSTTFSH